MSAQTMRPGAIQFHVTHDWNGQPLPQDLMIWVSPRQEPITKQLKPDCPCTQFWQMVVDVYGVHHWSQWCYVILPRYEVFLACHSHHDIDRNKWPNQ